MSSYHEGQVHQLMDKFEAVGFTADDLTKLGQLSDRDLVKIRDVIRGKAEITYPQHLIDCDVSPFEPEGLTVDTHIKGGQFSFDPTKVKLWLSEAQEKGDVISGNRLRKELVNQPVLNACVLDYLLANPELIPDEWKGKAVFFWGTIYRKSDGRLFVRCLDWNGVRWYSNYRWLYYGFFSDSPAALRAS